VASRRYSAPSFRMLLVYMQVVKYLIIMLPMLLVINIITINKGGITVTLNEGLPEVYGVIPSTAKYQEVIEREEV